MATHPLKTLLLSSLTLAPLAGCGGEAQEAPTAEVDATLASTRQSLSSESEYRIVTTGMDWSSAQAHCQSLGSGYNLATVNDAEEDSRLLRDLQALGLVRTWIGLNDRNSEGTFSWVGGSSSYTHWLQGEPNNTNSNEDCTELAPDWGGVWNDSNCALLRPFICERKLSIVSRNTSNYVFVTEGKDWNSAQAYCQGIAPGYHLVTVNGSQEEDFLAQQQQGHGLPIWWIGLNDHAEEGRFTWASGASAYNNFLPGEPNDALTGEDCTQDGWGAGRWNDFDCTDKKPFICEQSNNSPPVVSAGLDAAGYTHSALQLQGSAMDAEGETLGLQWTYAPGANVPAGARCSFGSPGSEATSFQCDTEGVYTVTLTAQDGDSVSVSASAQVTLSSASKVTQCNQPRFTRNTTLRLCGWATPGLDNSPIASAWFTVDDVPVFHMVPGTSGGFVSTTLVVGEGLHTVKLYAQSAKGHLTMQQVTTTVDTTAPSLTVRSFAEQDIHVGGLVNVTSDVFDTAPMTVTTQWQLKNELPAGQGTVTRALSLTNSGWNTILVQARDEAGNLTEVRARVYVKP